ncbi:MAG: saccharopine dehydrogenase family protein [Candidatus Limnocylindrales bacterium]
MADSARSFDLVVFGATGFVGRLLAAYLAEHAPPGLRVGLAGRSRARVEEVRAGLPAAGRDWRVLEADSGDPASLAELATATHVLVTTVGPYARYGLPVVEACARAGTHYADLTGEMPFVRRTIDAFQERATVAGVKIVQVCGFEALPPDLAVLLAAETARERWGEELAEADVEVATQQPTGRIGLADIISGGTLQSSAEAIGGEDVQWITDPAALVPDPELAAEVRSRSPIALGPRFNARGDVIAPMTPAAFINPAVIQRTAALLAAERGAKLEPFRYREGIAIPGSALTLPLRYAAAGGLAATQAGFAALTRARPIIRNRVADALRRFLPSSGFGPKGSGLEDWKWQVAVDARTTGRHYVRVDVDADGHPGYLTTSRILGETGLLLAEEGATADRAGCLTPAAALGTGNLGRLERAGRRFSVSS